MAAERGKLDLDGLLAAEPEEPVALSAITASELLHGVHRAATAAQRARREAFVEALLAELPILPFDTTSARVHARIWAELAANGVNVGTHDLVIAATAMAVGYRVATHDLRSFPKVPGLDYVKW